MVYEFDIPNQCLPRGMHLHNIVLIFESINNVLVKMNDLFGDSFYPCYNNQI